MQSKTLIRIIVALIFITVIFTPLFYFRWGVYPYTIAKQIFFQVFAELIFFLWLALAFVDKRFRPKVTPFTVGLAVFLVVLTFVAIFGVDPWRSFWSTYERMIGVVAIYHFAAFALVLSSMRREVPWKKLFYASLITALFIDIIALLQLYIPNLLLNEIVGGRPGATFGNPTFFSEYLIFNIFLAIYLLLDEWRNSPITSRERILRGAWSGFSFVSIFLATSFIFNIQAIFRAQTRGDLLGLGFGLIFLICIFVIRPPALIEAHARGEARPAGRPKLHWKIPSSRQFYAGLLLVILLAGSAFWLTRKNDFWSKVPGLSRFREVSFSLTDASIQPRLIAIRAAWRGFLDKPIFGWGPENFNIVFNKYYDPRALEANYQETRFDKPHNFFLEYLVTTGVLGILAYLSLLAVFFYELFRSGDALRAQVITAAIIAYIVGRAFAFETIGGLLMFYLVLGYVDNVFQEKKLQGDLLVAPGGATAKNASSRSSENGNFLAYGFIFIGCFIVYFLNIKTLQASYYQYRAFNTIVQGKSAIGIQSFRDAVATWSPYRWNFQRDFAAEAAQMYFYNPGFISESDVLDGVRAMEEARDEHPRDAFNHYFLIDIYNQVSNIDTEKFTALAEKEAAIALELSPDRQEIYFSLAKTKNIKGDNKAALDILKHALDLSPKVPEAHFYYGLLLFANNEPGEGYNEIKESINMGRKWKTFYEPRTVAGFFAENGYLQEAIELYKAALQMEPTDTETEIKIGVAYFAVGDLDMAREYLKKAGTKYDFKKSERYFEFQPILDKLGID
ncbi:MAG: O-antigen ligase family protein [bacterium]|nr:O-antigen ligase family protein [bacterium]